MRIQINLIKVKPGRREAVPEHIEELSKSISEVGLLNPITVDREYTLIAGLHRLEAAKLLGWTEIECTVSSLEGLQAELAELDENFIRSELSTVEYGELLLRRKEIYETLHPEAKNGGDRKSEKIRTTKCRSDLEMSFAQDTADKLGVSKRTIERQIKVAKDLTPETTELIRHFDISQKTARKLSRLEPEQQIEAAKLLVAGEVKSVEEYLSAHSADATSETQPMKEQPLADAGDRLTQDAPSSAGGDNTAVQSAAPDMKVDKPIDAKSDKMESEAAGRKTAEASAHSQTDRQPQRKTYDGKPKKARNKDEREGKGSPPDGSAGPQSTERPPERPFTLGEKQFGTFEESIADLKDPNKDCSCTPDSLLAEITEFVKKFYQEIEWFHLPYYEGVFPMLSQTQFDYLCRQMDSIHTAADQLTNHVKKGRVNAHGQKE